MLTQAQLTTLKASINTNTASYPGAIAARDGDTIANWFNLVTANLVWATKVNVASVYDAITWTNYTPVDAPDNTATFTNRALVIQTKQMNLQSMLQGRTTIDGSKANIRAGLRDATTALPAGASGAAVSAGGASGATVLNALTRAATFAENLFITSSPTTGTVTAGLMGFEGSLAGADILQALDQG